MPEVEVDELELRGVFVSPDNASEPSPAVLVIGGSEGGVGLRASRSFAGAGIPSLTVAYFGLPGLPGHLGAIGLELFGRALSWLADQRGVDADRLIVCGASRGSEAALLAGFYFPDLVRAVVAVVPGNVVLCGWGGDATREPAWLVGGEPLPYVDRFGPDCANADAVIPVEHIRGPVLSVGAGRDETWPSLAMARAIHERLRAHSHAYGDVLLEYPDAGHLIGHLAPLTDHEVELSRNASKTPEADQEARADAWPKVLAFIEGTPRR